MKVPEVAEYESVRHYKLTAEKLNSFDLMISSFRESEGSGFASRIDRYGAEQEEHSIKYGKTKDEEGLGDETVG